MQLVEIELPSGEEEFAGHCWHVDVPVAATAVEYFPSPHELQSGDPVDVVYFPGSHAAHGPPAGPEKPAMQKQLVEFELPGGEEEFAGHCWHVDIFVAATAVEYFPSPHEVHADAPGKCWYFPASHAVHVPPAGPHQPALQVQLLKAVLCSGELEPSGQPLQMLGPDTFLYLPAPHFVHDNPLAPDQPALQVQFVMLMLALGESEFVGQSLQLPAPAVSFHFPATHAVHAPPSGPE